MLTGEDLWVRPGYHLAGWWRPGRPAISTRNDAPYHWRFSLRAMPRVQVFNWNPRRSRLPHALTKRLPFGVGRRINNFGDLLGPILVTRILAMHQVDPRMAFSDRRLLTVGSVLHFARDHDVIWGTGVNGKKDQFDYTFRTLDVRAVRGPRTRDFLVGRGIEVPPVFGDPVLLLPHLMPELKAWSHTKRHPFTVVPNFNDFSAYDRMPALLDPRSPVGACLQRIAHSEFVVGSSLHAIVVAESLGIPARLISSSTEDAFKYDDYYLGTGRPGVEAARTVEEAVRMGGASEPTFDATLLLDAFPLDLWRTQ
jgi:pyruvyltransferase